MLQIIKNMNLYPLHLKAVLESNFLCGDKDFCDPACVCLVRD